MRRITVSDYTLREIEKEGGSRLLFKEKLAIAMGIDRYGADVIELPQVKNPKEDRIIFKTISQSMRTSVVAIPVGVTEDEVRMAAECVKGAQRSRLIVRMPVSTVQMEYQYHMKGPKMLEKIAELVACARSLSEDVEFQAGDATRCEMDFLIQACQTAKDAGATCVTLSDDAGLMMPDEFSAMVKSVMSAVKIAVNVQVSDIISLAVADALAALAAGANGVNVAVTGQNALKVEAFSEAIKVKGDQLGIKSGLKLTELHSDIESLLRKMQTKMQTKAQSEEYAGSDGVAIFLDLESSVQQVSDATKSLGYDLSEEDLGRVYEALMRLCEHKSSIGGKELEAIIASTAMQVPATYKLKSYIGTMSNKVNSVTSVILERQGERLSGTGTGNGPIDSAFMAIEQCIGHHYELDDFQIQAVTEGKESLGSALVRLRSNGKLYSGNGLSSDICGASIRAYINALNKIAFEESQR